MELIEARQAIVSKLVTRIKANGYKLRMSKGKWFLWLFYNQQDLGYQWGPFTFKEGLAAAQRHSLTDLDKEMFAEMAKKEEAAAQSKG